MRSKWKEWLLGDWPRSLIAWVLVVSALAGLIAFFLFLADRCSGDSGATQASISMGVDAEWDTERYENSHWGALVSWATTGDIDSCKLSDDQGSKPEYVPVISKKPRRYGSYAGSVADVRIHLHCEGPRDADKSRTATKPEGPILHPQLQVHESDWLGRATKTHWEARLTYSGGSVFAVNCWLWDDVNQADFHKDPSGETTGYGNFSAAIAQVKIHLKCDNVAGVDYVSDPVIARRPQR